MPRKRAEPSVPIFHSDEEEFEFWETHDVEDYLTGETVSLESLFTPEGIEWVEATRATRQNRRKRART